MCRTLQQRANQRNYIPSKMDPLEPEAPGPEDHAHHPTTGPKNLGSRLKPSKKPTRIKSVPFLDRNTQCYKAIALVLRSHMDYTRTGANLWLQSRAFPHRATCSQSHLGVPRIQYAAKRNPGIQLRELEDPTPGTRGSTVGARGPSPKKIPPLGGLTFAEYDSHFHSQSMPPPTEHCTAHCAVLREHEPCTRDNSFLHAISRLTLRHPPQPQL